MKSKRLAKLIALAVTALLLIGVAVGFSVSAAETTAEIGYINVAYEGQLRLVYDVKNVTLDEGEKLAVLIWEDGEDQTIENAQVVVDCEPCRSDAYSRFYSDGFAPKDLRKPVSAVAAVVDGETGEVEIGENIVTYSVYDYVMGRFAYGKNTPDQQALYIALLDYGAAVQEVLYDSYIAQGATKEVATAQAGLTYGYSDAYYVVNYVKSAYVGGKLTTSVEKHALRPYETVKINADQTYMRRVFEKYSFSDGLDVTYLYDNKGEEVVIEKDQLAQGTARYVHLRPTEIGYTTITASYGMEAGSAIYTSSVLGMNTGASTSKVTNLSTESDGTYQTIIGDGVDTSGNPYIIFSKQIRQISDPNTSTNPRGGSATIKKEADNVLKGDVHVTEFDVSLLGNYVLDRDGDTDTTNGTRDYDRYSGDARKGQTAYVLNIRPYGKNSTYYFRVNMHYDNNKKGMVFEIASDGTSFEAKRTFSADGTTYTDEKGGRTNYKHTVEKFANSITGETVISAKDIKNIRIEVHHDGQTTREYRIYHYESDGKTLKKDGDGKDIYDSYTIVVPVLKLYINDVYWGSSSSPYLYPNYDSTNKSTPTDPKTVTTYGNAITNGNLQYEKVELNQTMDGCAEVRISNWLVSAYDYNSDGTIALTNPDNEINYGVGEMYDYDKDSLKNDYSDIVSIRNSATVVDGNKTSADSYINTSDNALWFGANGVVGERGYDLKVPESVTSVANKKKFIFSTDFYWESGASAAYNDKQKDWLRIRFASKPIAGDSSGSVTSFTLNPTAEVALANAGEYDQEYNIGTDKILGTDEWHNITIIYDYELLVADIYIDGVLSASNVVKQAHHPDNVIEYVAFDRRGQSSGMFSNTHFAIDNTYFGVTTKTTTATVTNSQTWDYEDGALAQLDNNKDYVKIENINDKDRGSVMYFHYSSDGSVGSEAHLRFNLDKAFAKLDSTHYFELETYVKFGNIDAKASDYKAWMMYLSLTDQIETGTSDNNSSACSIYFNEAATKATSPTSGIYYTNNYTTTPYNLKANTWYKIRIVYRVVDEATKKCSVALYVDDTYMCTAIVSGSKIMDNGIAGGKIKFKNTNAFTDFNMYLDDTVIREYTITESTNN